jgi:uncharacterized protein (DUF2147 family)
MIEQRKFLAAGLAILLAIPAAFAGGNAWLIGNWARDDGTVRIVISPCGTDLCAVNTWVKNTDTEEKIGDKLILDLQPVTPSQLQGQAYDVRRQKHFKMTITQEGGTAMQTQGCILLGILCKSVGWTRND